MMTLQEKPVKGRKEEIENNEKVQNDESIRRRIKDEW
jgi:hypothetical protein